MQTCRLADMKACRQTDTQTHTHGHTDIQTYMHTCIRAYMHTCMRTCLHTYVHTYILTDIHTYILTYIHTYLQTYFPTYILTYILTYLHMLKPTVWLVGGFVVSASCVLCHFGSRMHLLCFCGCILANLSASGCSSPHIVVRHVSSSDKTRCNSCAVFNSGSFCGDRYVGCILNSARWFSQR